MPVFNDFDFQIALAQAWCKFCRYGKTQHFAQFLPAKISPVSHLRCTTSLLLNIDAARATGNFQYSRKLEFPNFLWLIFILNNILFFFNKLILFIFLIIFYFLKIFFPHIDVWGSCFLVGTFRLRFLLLLLLLLPPLPTTTLHTKHKHTSPHTQQNNTHHTGWHHTAWHSLTSHCLTSHSLTWHRLTSHSLKTHSLTWHRLTSHSLTSHSLISRRLTSHSLTSHSLTSRRLTSHSLTSQCLMSGVGLGAPAGGLMYALVCAGRRAGRWTLTWQVWDLLHLHGVWCTLWCARAAALAPGFLRGGRGSCYICAGSDVHFGVRGPPRWPLDFCVAGVGLAAFARGLMYALVCTGRRAGRWTFAWQVWELLHLHGVWCTLWCAWAAALAAGFLRGRRGTCCICTGSDVHFGVRGPPRWPLDLCVAGVGLTASAQGLMYALMCAGRCAGRWTFAWQAWGLLHLHGVWWTLWELEIYKISDFYRTCGIAEVWHIWKEFKIL